MTKAELIKKITEFQHNSAFHPLTCGNDSSHHPVLEAKEINGKILLVCPAENCGYTQDWIPEYVLTL